MNAPQPALRQAPLPGMAAAVWLAALCLAALCLTACATGSPPGSASHDPAQRGGVAPAASALPGNQAVGQLPTHQPAAGPTPTRAHCTRPAFTTSEHQGGWNTQGYFVYNDMWNDSVPLGPQTLYACAYNDWYVVSNQTDSAGAVKTYPNVHKDFNEPAISSLATLTSSFAATAPRVGIYDVAFDIWTNGVATSNSTEIMIWTENFHQVPSGDKAKTVTLSGRSYDVYRTSNGHYLAFVPKSVIRSGTLNVLELLKWTIAQGFLATNSTLGQVDYGVEIVDTGGRSQTFSFTNFSLTSS